MRIPKEQTAAIIIDVQEKLYPVMYRKLELRKNLVLLVEGLKLMDIPIQVTQQYTKGLGETIPVVAKSIGNFKHFEKLSFSCCGDAEFSRYVEKSGKKYFIIAGVETHVCVLQTVLDLLAIGFTPILVADCVTSRSKFDKEIAIKRMIHAGAIVTTVESLLFELCGVAGTPVFKSLSKLIVSQNEEQAAQNILSIYKRKDKLIKKSPKISKMKEIPEVNGHLHSPYSFSAFSDIRQMFDMAKSENVKVLGINDFNVTDGYKAFYDLSLEYRIFPLFNIEFIALDKDKQKNNIRVNDPNNPGRTYFSGKGLAYPPHLDSKSAKLVDRVKSEGLKQIEQMVAKTNELLGATTVKFRLSVAEIKSKYCKELIRERHIAKALRIAVFEELTTDELRVEFFNNLFAPAKLSSDIKNSSALENEIRNNLLKAGGKAFVVEEESAFLTVDEVKEIIINAGGIPCYPVLLDDKNGKFTDYEGNPEAMLKDLVSRNIFCIELIPNRNDFKIMKEFVMYFRKNGFVVLLGSEHNTPDLFQIALTCRNNVALDEDLKKLSYESACVVAAHQYLVAQGEKGYVNSTGKTDNENMDYYISLGNAVINRYIHHK